jgi:hypothetical protein
MEKTALSVLLQKILLVPMVALWALHLYQRKFKDAGTRKRIATLSLTLVLIGGWAAAWLFSRYGVGDEWLVLVAVCAAAIVIWQRRLMLPFRRRCVKCGAALSMTRVFSWDSNRCEACEPHAAEGETTR